MTPADQKMLKEIREDLGKIAKKLKEAHEKGYTANFNVDVVTGEVTSFAVKATVDIDQTLN